ncbi:MAG: GerMN domain-containing protein [Clostridia bacterium]|nr:GerMN domain-containing protein [Clostridia bacterium]
MKKSKVGVILFIVILIIALVGYLIIVNLDNKTEEISDGDIQEYTPQEEISESQYRETIVNLYFLNKDTGELMAEAKAIDAKTLVDNPYKALVDLLMQKTENDRLQTVIPEGVTIYDANIEAGCVTINASKEILNYNNDEVLKSNIINSITKTLCELTEVNGIRFLVDGEENAQLPDKYTIM